MKRTEYTGRYLRSVVLAGLLLSIAAASEAALHCFDCHGSRTTIDIRPLDNAFRNLTTGGFRGNHRTHMTSPAAQADCAVCHPGSDSFTAGHRDGVISISKNINSSPAETLYGNHTTPFPQRFDYTGNLLDGCTNVNCHFETTTPNWGNLPLASTECNACHLSPPTDGSHIGKHSTYYGTATNSCIKCHTDHTSESNPLAHAREAGKRSLIVTPNVLGRYTGGSHHYPDYLQSQNPSRSGSCYDTYCHSDGTGRAPNITPVWSGPATACYSCHRGQTNDQYLGSYINMTSNGHGRLVGPQWIRKYPCTYCHNETVAPVKDSSNNVTDGAILIAKHVNGTKDVSMDSKWAIVGKDAPSYDSATKVCDNVYCHSDGTTDPEQIRPFAWSVKKTSCNTCHGHPVGTCNNSGCHDGRPKDEGGYWVLPAVYGNLTAYKWPSGQEWKAAIPMFANAGPGTSRANSHARHTETEFTCDHCHASTIINGSCTDCHKTGIPPGAMTEVSHLNGEFHVNKTKDVFFKGGGSFNSLTKTCSNTACHTGGTDPVWGESVTRTVICLNCHGTSGSDVDDFGEFNGIRAKINLTEWTTTGHGRQAASGPYPVSGNPAANFPGNPCWYCHDNAVLHKDSTNPYRLRQHQQFIQRFYKECGYCHMQGVESECLGCHNSTESIGLQLSSDAVKSQHSGNLYLTGCRNTGCHPDDSSIHKTGSPFWTAAQNEDVKSQYVMMGVCLKCHDDDSGGKCTECHTAPESNPLKYSLGFNPGTGFIIPTKARASSVHFGYKHYRAYQANGVWKGGKFCWDCHDPHGDSNIYMIQKKVATSTDGRFGKPVTRADVSFTRKQSGLDYARIEAPYDGICNVCHSFQSRHYNYQGGDNHNTGRICTTCHEHRFTDSHANSQPCNTCHNNKPVPRHSGFGLPKDCTKCHGGAIGMRMDVMGQFRANSHHVQGVTVSNKHCYACHWESTPEGLINVNYHEGFNFKNYSTVKFAKVDLVVWGAGYRPTYYNTTTSVQFTASRMSQDNSTARAESGKVTNHCLSCHSDQNNETTPFSDCKTPRQYAWDGQSIGARYSRTDTTTWGKYSKTSYPNVNGKGTVVKAFSAHGNAIANQGGFKNLSGFDGAVPNRRGGAYNVTCYDCHSSHGSKVTGVTSSYVTFNGTRNGANLKETQAGKGGYSMSYKASSNTNTGTVNPYNAGAGQCFDCHLTQNSGTTPWGYLSTFGASSPVMGYTDTSRFGQGIKASVARYPFRSSKATILGGHMKAYTMLSYTTSASNKINGLCTPCHDPHGVSPSLGENMSYAVPMLKGTWMTSPYRDDTALTNTGDHIYITDMTWKTDRNSLSSSITSNVSRISESDSQFAGLCVRCHPKSRLSKDTCSNPTYNNYSTQCKSSGATWLTNAWKSKDRVHQSVQGWGANKEHSYTCSKCHQPHNSGLPRLMQTNCLDLNHRGNKSSGGAATRFRSGWRAGNWIGFPRGNNTGISCHNSYNNTYYSSDYLYQNNKEQWNNITNW